MIQRIQSVWLFLAAMLNGLLFICPLYRYTPAGATAALTEGVRNYMPLFIAAAVATLLPLVTIFFYGDRKRQKGMIWISLISCLSLFGLMLSHLSNLKNATPPVTNVEYVLPGILVTLAAVVLELLAIRGIRKDEKLIKSLDRLR